MGHGHDHGTLTGRRLLLSVFITIAFVIGEAVAGYFSNSLALLSDAGHNFLVVWPLDCPAAVLRKAHLRLSPSWNSHGAGQCGRLGGHCFVDLLGSHLTSTPT